MCLGYATVTLGLTKVSGHQDDPHLQNAPMSKELGAHPSWAGVTANADLLYGGIVTSA